MSFILLMIGFSRFNVDFASIISQLLTSFYMPGYNLIPAGYIYEVNVMELTYLVIVTTILNLYLINLLILKFNKRSKPSKIYIEDIKKLIVISLITIIFLQTNNQINYSVKEFNKSKNLPFRSHRPQFFTNADDIAQLCKNVLPGKHNAYFKTDIDLSTDPGMLFHRALAYYLYPIDIRNTRKDTKDSLIVFQKHNPKSELTDDWQLLTIIDNKSLLAIRKIK